MARRIGILTSGGDCPGLNAAIRGAAKAAYERFPDVEIVGVTDGYAGLIEGESRAMRPSDFSGILTVGGTILGTSRQPFKSMRVASGPDELDKIERMKQNYSAMRLSCLLVLGGNGTHKTANLLSDEGLNVICLPKTIDNDLFGTEVTFGFHTAVDIATDVIDRLHTTAASHGRVMVVELMGNKAGWLTLYAGLAGGADILLLPEIPFDMDAVALAIQRRAQMGKVFSIVAVAEGALDVEEARMKKKQRMLARAARGERTVTQRVAMEIERKTGVETRVCVPGHVQRGGSPCAYDRVLSTQFGVYAAELIARGEFGTTVAMVNHRVTHNRLCDVAGKTKLVSPDAQMVQVARSMGVSFGDG